MQQNQQSTLKVTSSAFYPNNSKKSNHVSSNNKSNKSNRRDRRKRARGSAGNSNNIKNPPPRSLSRQNSRNQNRPPISRQNSVNSNPGEGPHYLIEEKLDASSLISVNIF